MPLDSKQVEDGLDAGYQKQCAEGYHGQCSGTDENCTCPCHEVRNTPLVQ